MSKIYVDADACPVKDETLKVVARHNTPVHFVANQWLRLPQSPLIHMQLAPEGPDEADNWIAEHINADDICITGDIPLAARCIKKGAAVINHNGQEFTEDSIGMALASRDLMTHLRDIGEIEGGSGKSFSKSDRSKFLSNLDTLVQKSFNPK
ncbi:YaiI/YqxD family protein [Terasakiella sp. SH-1]|uniref:YaiI/YqxD family protein n=1 Tax=Terasakiella sp. SH-1 TaxID=2560057 RepID=UPI00107410BA|nr:YaiI/YqxD family protein [Terasakiella sp. SH-1]